MKKSLILSLVLTITSTNFVFAEEIQNNQKLLTTIETVKNSCSGIKGEYDTIFGLNVATSVLSGVGTVASTAALGVGIAKANLDKKIEEKEQQIYQFGGCGDASSLDSQNIDASIEQMKKMISCVKDKEKIVKDLEAQIDKETKKSKQLGNARTGLMMGATATSAISMGTSIGSVVGLKKLTEKMGSCNSALKDLKIVKGKVQAEINEIDDSEEKNKIEKEKLNTAKNVLENCKEFDSKVLTAMSNKSIASAAISGIGSTTGLVGTITSAIANTDKTRNDNSISGKKKEKALNLTANITAGIVAGTSATSTILSGITAAQVKKESEKAGKCEETLSSI